MKIKNAVIHGPEQWGDPATVDVIWEDGTEEKKFMDFYDDEIGFSPDEFVGLTREEAFALKERKDRALFDY